MNIPVKNISIRDFSYSLPEEKIAKFPLVPRDSSKLLIYKEGVISTSNYRSIDVVLPNNSILIFNNTKVVAARLLFEKATGALIEIFCLEPHNIYGDITEAMLQKKHVLWKCLIGGAKKWKEGSLNKTILHEGKSITLSAHKEKKQHDYFLVSFSWTEEYSFAEILSIFGNIPLPPYLNRTATQEDEKTYQTIYAKREGSVAAPTAGLHFTNTVLEKLNEKGIAQQYVTLHVGAGTFKPVKAETMDAHDMHAEYIEVDKSFIQALQKQLEDKIVAVGTTSLRTIESLYWLGVQCLQNNNTDYLAQWDCYSLPQDIDAQKALQALIDELNATKKEKLLAKTRIIIAPGYQLKIAKGLITNFHQPNSTLLLLVAAIVGEDWKKIYDYALQHDFRFLSYGDGSLLWK